MTDTVIGRHATIRTKLVAARLQRNGMRSQKNENKGLLMLRALMLSTLYLLAMTTLVSAYALTVV